MRSIAGLRSSLLELGGRILKKRAARAEYVRVVNLTRQSELASHVEVADQGARRRKGLLGVDELAPGEGLWIAPCEAVHTFGMRFAIDLVYLDRSRRIVKIRHRVPRSRISGCLRAHSVLELRAGSAADAGAQVGDQLECQPVLSSTR